MLLEIKNLKFKAIIGILPRERSRAQNVVLDSKIYYNPKHKSLASFGGYLDYGEIINELKNMVIERKFELLEDALSEILPHFLNTHKAIYKMSLTISKPDIFKECDVSITHTMSAKTLVLKSMEK
ncbi:FolB domain-containing protein [Helicobacter saguini]|uniref:Dihydroneopterin aldolase n=1 Tax=Helicobacter saguini TaxID=1548018 RepID=A0A347W3X9_9HELI|nr:dihydroneopterin aldolase [Helicobacter saguini]MWV62066.1 FolB domain-containing protein [Helicobacter saguini]MWV67260.1 FolB domain-containing protein [Helicobacter saguini]MWV69614.1 FolB domain-containing protein [Helicobacter saguini]MWV70836.1 FolB domain-containing protein [Helicobacter saguini]TLD94326.1 dihydroneopterin aldolase [Helicobacter saguini]